MTNTRTTLTTLTTMTIGVIMIFGAVLCTSYPGTWTHVGDALFGVGIGVFLIGAIGYLLHPTSRR